MAFGIQFARTFLRKLLPMTLGMAPLASDKSTPSPNSQGSDDQEDRRMRTVKFKLISQ